MIQIYPWIRELTSVHLQPLQCWNTILQSFTFMRANILLIMKDLFIPLLLWVLLLCHKRPSQKLNGNTGFVFGNHSAKLRSGCLTILSFTSVFLKLNNFKNFKKTWNCCGPHSTAFDIDIALHWNALDKTHHTKCFCQVITSVSDTPTVEPDWSD